MRAASFKRGVNTELLKFSLFGLLIYLRAFFAGFRYFPVLDDFIQYGCYPSYDNPVADVFIRIGILEKRPLTGLFDVFVWGKMWDGMAWAAFIILTFYILTVYLIYKSFEFDKMRGGIWFLLLFALNPLMNEGLYWVSASSRIVVGLFFGSVACYLLYQYVVNYCEKRLIPYMCIACILSFGFYEQVICAVFALMMLLIYKYRKDIKDRIVFFIPLISLALIGGYYILMQYVGSSELGASGRLAFSIGNAFASLTQSFEILSGVQYAYLTDTFMRGFSAIFSIGGFVYLLIVILASLGLGAAVVLDYDPRYILGAKGKNSSRFLILSGVILFFAALFPNMAAQDGWVCLRNIAVPLIGIGFIWVGLSEYVYIHKYVMGAMVGLLAFVFTVSGIGDVAIYKQVSEYDRMVGSAIAQQIERDEAVLAGEREVVLLNPSLFYEQLKPFYKDHVKSVTYTDWALTGCVRDAAGNLGIKKVTPVWDGMTVENLEDKLVLMMFHGEGEQPGQSEVRPLTLKGTGLIDQNGELTAKWINNTIIFN